MRKLLSAPVKMALSDSDNVIYQNILQNAAELSLNLMAVKVENRPEDFLSWSYELHRLTREDLRHDLLDPPQLVPLRKMQDWLEKAISITQLKMARIAPWPIFVAAIEQHQENHGLAERMKLLSYISELRTTPLAELPLLDRQVVAGKHTSQHDHSVYDFDVEWFGSTKGAKVFHVLLEQEPAGFDQALAHIPLTGEVSYEDYKKFVSAYSELFANYKDAKESGEKAPLAPASRLLAMRRPDQFIALNNSKLDLICQGFASAKYNGFDFDGYWHETISSLRSFAWWRASAPDQEAELAMWQNRAVLIDLLFFATPETAAQSNYLRLRDKPVRTTKSAGGSRARTRETAETLVDKALSAEGMPAYMQGKREALINEVKGGKSVDEAIGLMRMIFG